MRLRVFPVLCVVPAFLLQGCGRDQAPAGEDTGGARSSPGSTVATVTTAAGDVTLRLDVAADARAQEKGLAGRKELPRSSGMLFPLDPPRTPNFWMKGMLVPLDVLFIQSDGTVSGILTRKPNDLTPMSTGEPVRGVIEIGQGEAARLGIAEGDRVRWGSCGGAGKSDPLRFCPE